MSEGGGTTTQSGILYQNRLAALYLGRMLDPADRPDCERVVEVRVEAPTEVDDFVVTFADGHTAYFQAKENIEPSGDTWGKMWQHLQAQLAATEFKRGTDRVVLHFGKIQPWHDELSQLCKRAGTSKTQSEFKKRLSKALQGLLARISSAVSPSPIVFDLLCHTDVKILSTDEADEDEAQRWMPASNIKRPLLYARLLHLVATGSTVRQTFRVEGLLANPKGEGVEIGVASNAHPISALHGLPSPPTDFTGSTAELEELLKKVTTGGVAISGLRGMGGKCWAPNRVPIMLRTYLRHFEQYEERSLRKWSLHRLGADTSISLF